MLRIGMAWVILTAAGAAAAPAHGGPGEGPAPRWAGAAADTGSPKAAVTAGKDRRAYVRDMRERLRAADRKLDELMADSLARYRADSVYRREVLAKARTERDHVETLMDDLSAVAGSIAPQPWDSLESGLRLSLDSLQRLFLAADSSGKAALDDGKRAGPDPRIDAIRSGGGRESRRERRDVEESRRGR